MRHGDNNYIARVNPNNVELSDIIDENTELSYNKPYTEEVSGWIMMDWERSIGY